MIQSRAMDDQPKRGRGRPATGQTPVRTIRVGEVWDQAQKVARARGESMATVVADCLRRYVKRNAKGTTE